MQTKEYRTVNRAGWPSGEWDGEPDKVQFQDTATGLPCLAVRNAMGAWCGYVGVTEGHPDFGKDAGDVDHAVHGGITFANFCQPHEDEATGICHLPEPGEPDRVYWLGFDCSHGYDRAPCDALLGANFLRMRGRAEYRTLNYVKTQCQLLALQLAQQVAP